MGNESLKKRLRPVFLGRLKKTEIISSAHILHYRAASTLVFSIILWIIRHIDVMYMLWTLDGPANRVHSIITYLQRQYTRLGKTNRFCANGVTIVQTFNFVNFLVLQMVTLGLLSYCHKQLKPLYVVCSIQQYKTNMNDSFFQIQHYNQSKKDRAHLHKTKSLGCAGRPIFSYIYRSALPLIYTYFSTKKEMKLIILFTSASHHN